jgi:hypothetical protein
MIAPEEFTRHPDWRAIVVGFANQSGLGEAASGAGSFAVVPDASGVQVFGLTARQAGLPGVTVLQAAPAVKVR